MAFSCLGQPQLTRELLPTGRCRVLAHSLEERVHKQGPAGEEVCQTLQGGLFGGGFQLFNQSGHLNPTQASRTPRSKGKDRSGSGAGP